MTLNNRKIITFKKIHEKVKWSISVKMQERASSVPNLHKKIPNSPNSLTNDLTRRKHHFNRFQENKKKEKSIHDLNFSQAILQTLETSNSSLLNKTDRTKYNRFRKESNNFKNTFTK